MAALRSASVTPSWARAVAWTNGEAAVSAPARSAAIATARTPLRTLTLLFSPSELPRQRRVNAAGNLRGLIRERAVVRFEVRLLQQVLAHEGHFQRRQDLPADADIHLRIARHAAAFQAADVAADHVELDVL